MKVSTVQEWDRPADALTSPAWAGTLAGIDDGTPSPEGGVISRRPDGRYTGLLA